MPQFATPLALQQAQLLMQPALIRLIDNIRKQLDHSDWEGSYKDEIRWPQTVTADQKQQYLAAQEMLEAAPPGEQAKIQAMLERLPQPQHIYILCLKQQTQQHEVNLWHLCYQLCSTNYDPAEPNTALEIDTHLIDPELGDVDWIKLDAKAKALIEKVFSQLPQGNLN